MSDFRELVRLKRKDAGLSQKKLGEACGLSDTTISKIEGGSRETPQWDTLCKIAQALKFHPFEILLAAGYITEDDENLHHSRVAVISKHSTMLPHRISLWLFCTASVVYCLETRKCDASPQRVSSYNDITS